MTKYNLSQVEEILTSIAYEKGSRLGKQITKAIESGELVIPANKSLALTFHSLHPYLEDYPMYKKVLAKIGSPEFSVGGNVCLAAGGLGVASLAYQNYIATQNPMARWCYRASFVCGSTAFVSGALKGATDQCRISHLAMYSDAFGTTFLYLGNRARDLGLCAEGKAKPPKLSRFRRAPRAIYRRFKGPGFIITPHSSDIYYIEQIMAKIPYQKIILIGGTIFAIYSYCRLIIRISRKLASKFSPKIDTSKLIRSQARFLIDQFSYTRSVKRIYHFAGYNNKILFLFNLSDSTFY